MHKKDVWRREFASPTTGSKDLPEPTGKGVAANSRGDSCVWPAESPLKNPPVDLEQRHPFLLGKAIAESLRPGCKSSQVNSLFQAQEDAAKQIAQRLHDDAAQMLAVVYLELANISRNCPAETAEKIDGVVGLLDGVCDQLRGLSHELRPLMLEHSGLVPALHTLAESVHRRSGLHIVVRDEPVALPPAVEIALYRVVQEALSNVVRHARATEVEIALWVEGLRVYCAVSDNGEGMARSAVGLRASYGLGLVGIYERVAALRGDCRIVCGEHGGTTLEVEIPL